MSAFICTHDHIATCAAAIKQHASDVDNIEESGIRLMLAKENMDSVAYRYGPVGAKVYARMFTEQLCGSEALQRAEEEISQRDAEAELREMLPGGMSSVEFLSLCESAEPQPQTNEELVKRLGCLEYQSCEHPEWKTSESRRWIHETLAALARELADKALNGRHVWDMD